MITPAQAADAIRRSRGRFFGCTFTKHQTGETRTMWARFAVVGSPKGPHRNRDDLIVVWDHHKRGYRSIPVEGLTQLRIDGRVEEVRSSGSRAMEMAAELGDLLSRECPLGDLLSSVTRTEGDPLP